MILGIPVQDGLELTQAFVANLASQAPNLKVVIIDNASERPYQLADFATPISIIQNTKNEGYYAPLKQLYDEFPDEELIGLAHNDMLIYEMSWDMRMAKCFEDDPKLMLVGLCGSYEVDERGGRGGGTHVNFRGEHGFQSPAAGAKNVGLIPSACLDSLFMMFRREAVPILSEDWGALPLAHFYDRIWPLRLANWGYHVGTLGVECDHMGGMTTVGNIQYRNDCMSWLEKHRIPYENPETEMYLEAERRYFREFKDTKLIPCRVMEDYSYVPTT